MIERTFEKRVGLTNERDCVQRNGRVQSFVFLLGSVLPDRILDNVIIALYDCKLLIKFSIRSIIEIHIVAIAKLQATKNNKGVSMSTSYGPRDLLLLQPKTNQTYFGGSLRFRARTKE